MTGGPRTQLSGTAGGIFIGMIYTGGEHVYFLESQGSGLNTQLFRFPVDGSAPSFDVSSIPSSRAVEEVWISENALTVAYAIDNGNYWVRTVAVGLDSLSPQSGSASGGTRVTVSGSAFTADTEVLFDGVPALNGKWIDERTIVVETPPTTIVPIRTGGPTRAKALVARDVDVTVMEANTQATSVGAFRYTKLR